MVAVVPFVRTLSVECYGISFRYNQPGDMGHPNADRITDHFPWIECTYESLDANPRVCMAILTTQAWCFYPMYAKCYVLITNFDRNGRPQERENF